MAPVELPAALVRLVERDGRPTRSPAGPSAGPARPAPHRPSAASSSTRSAASRPEISTIGTPTPGTVLGPDEHQPGHAPVDVGRAGTAPSGGTCGPARTACPAPCPAASQSSGSKKRSTSTSTGSRAPPPVRPASACTRSRSRLQSTRPSRLGTGSSTYRHDAPAGRQRRRRRGWARSPGSRGPACSVPSSITARKAPSQSAPKWMLWCALPAGGVAPHARHPQHAARRVACHGGPPAGASTPPSSVR